MTNNNNNYDKELSLRCFNCYKFVPSISIYCPFCGVQVGDSVSNSPEHSVNPSFSINHENLINSRKKPAKPGLFKLPIFFVVFCIFGLEIFLEFIVIMVYLLFSSTEQISDEVYLILSSVIRLLQVFVIFYFLTRNQNMKRFRPFSKISSGNQTSTQTGNNFFYSLRTTFLAIPLIISIVYLIETISLILINSLKSIFNITDSYSSPYTSYTETDSLFIIFAISVIILAPILEEILFRGFLQYSFMRANLSDWSQYFLQAFLFAFLHLLPDIVGNSSIDFISLHMISTASLAIGATWLRKKYKSVTYPILLHTAWNSLSLIFSLIPDIVQSDSDLRILDLFSTLFFTIVIIATLIIMKLVKEWELGIPQAIKSLKSEKNNVIYKIVVITIIFAVFVNLLQFLPIFLESKISDIQIITYIMFINVFSIFSLFIWSSHLYDSSISEILKKEEM